MSEEFLQEGPPQKEMVEGYKDPVSDDLLKGLERQKQQFIDNKNLNPKSWKDRLLDFARPKKIAQSVALAGALGANAVAGNEFKDAVVDATKDPNFGRPIENSAPYEARIVGVQDNNEDKINPPIFRSEPSKGGRELTPEELAERGIFNTNTELFIRDVTGGTYETSKPDYTITDPKTGKSNGVWGQLMTTNSAGELEEVDIFVAENFVQKIPTENSSEFVANK